MDVDQLLYAMRPVELRPPLGDADVRPAGQGLANDEEVGRPLTLVLVVLTGWPPRADGEGLRHLSHELLALLLQANLCGKRSS